MSPLKVGERDNDATGQASIKKEKVVKEQKQSQPRNITSELDQSVPVSAADDEDYFVVEGNDSDEDHGNINKALEREE